MDLDLNDFSLEKQKNQKAYQIGFQFSYDPGDEPDDNDEGIDDVGDVEDDDDDEQDDILIVDGEDEDDESETKDS